jgi:uncharacterized protein (TIGR00251 family)
VIAIVPHAEGAIVSVVGQPGSKRNGVLGERAGAIRIAVTAPPEKGKANAAIQSVLAENLGCKTAQVSLISGAASRQKRFLIRGIDNEELRKRLDSVLVAIANRKQPAGDVGHSDP